MGHPINKASEYQDRESQEVQTGQGFRQAFVIKRQPPEAGGPSEAALDHPAAGQQDKAFLGVWKFDHFQLDSVYGGGLGRRLARIALIDIAQFDRVTGHLLHLLRQSCTMASNTPAFSQRCAWS